MSLGTDLSQIDPIVEEWHRKSRNSAIRKVDEDTMDAGKRVDDPIAPVILPREVRLSDFHGATEGGEEGTSAASVAIAGGLAVRVLPSIVRIANVEVAHEEANPNRLRRPACSRYATPQAKFLQCAIGLVMKVNNRAVAAHLPNPHEVITSQEKSEYIFANQKNRAS